ncbi:MAG: M4 family metallopeptidase, partial [Myxococcota bacterium]
MQRGWWFVWGPILAAASCAGADAPSGGAKPGPFDAADDDAQALASDQAESWLDEVGNPARFGVEAYALRSVEFDALGEAHVRVQQLVGDVPVFGRESVIHLQPDGKIRFTDGWLHDVAAVDLAPDLTPDDAIASTLSTWSGEPTRADADLQLVRHDGVDHLAWRVSLADLTSDTPSMPVVFVDAHTGDEIWRYENLQTIRNRLTYTVNNGTALPGTLLRSEGSADIGDAAVDAAHNFAGATYDYYFVHQGRDSYDNAGATLKSSAHYSFQFDNAFWDGAQMVYGDGGFFFRPLSLAEDVVAHELTHAVTERTAGLIYSGESGGLNEGTSDIFGAVIEASLQGFVVDANTWKVGEVITLPAFGEALRFMDDPTLDGISIDNYAQYNGGIDVHYSSGIANKAFFLMSTDPALGIESAADVWYRALTVYMTPSTTFANGRQATVLAATDLFGAGSAQVSAVENAWAGVGV